MNLLLGVGFGMIVEGALVFFLCDRGWGWYGSTRMLAGYGFTIGVLFMLIAGAKLAKAS